MRRFTMAITLLVAAGVLLAGCGAPDAGTPAGGQSRVYTGPAGWSFAYPASWDRVGDGFVQETSSGKTVTFDVEASTPAEVEAWLASEIARKLAATEADNSLAEPLTTRQQAGLTVYRYAILSRGDGSETLLRTTVFFDGARRYELDAAIPPVTESEYEAIIASFKPAAEQEPVLTWHREGGIAGFCDDLTVYAGGDVVATSCKKSPAQEVGHGRLSAEQQQQIDDWLGRLQPFQVSQGDGAVADTMTVDLAFSGQGATVPSEADKQAVLLWAQDLYAQTAGQP